MIAWFIQIKNYTGTNDLCAALNEAYRPQHFILNLTFLKKYFKKKLNDFIYRKKSMYLVEKNIVFNCKIKAFNRKNYCVYSQNILRINSFAFKLNIFLRNILSIKRNTLRLNAKNCV